MIVAEEITNRFFNVIFLMNRAIPIIAIQLNALRLDDAVILNFTRVLDLYESPEDETDLGAESTDRSYWQGRTNPKSLSVMDQLISIAQGVGNVRVSYRKYDITLGTPRRHFCWFHPRKKEGYCHLNLRVGADNISEVKDILEGAGISFNLNREDALGLSVQAADLRGSEKKIKRVMEIAFASQS